MAIAVQQIHPVAHLPLVLGVLRHLEIATVIDRLVPLHPAHVVSCGRGVEALVLAILDGDHALYKVGTRLEERGCSRCCSRVNACFPHDYRLGHILDALFAANLNTVFGAIALKALEVYALPTPWLHQDTTTIALYGIYEDEPKADGAPRPAYGHSKDGRADLKQVLLSLGVSGDGGIPLRVGLRDGNCSDSVETPRAIEECLALGLDGVRGIVADSKAYSRRTLGLCLEHGIGLVTLVPRTCAIRQELEAWGCQHPPLPLLAEKPGRTRDEAPGAGVAKAYAVRSRSNTVMGGSPKRRCALWWSIRVNWRSSKRRPMQRHKGKKRRRWQTTCGRCTRGGSPACPMPKQPSPSMRTGHQSAAGAVHTRGGITLSAITSSQPPAARAVLGGDGQPRRTHPLRSRAIGSRSRSRPSPILKRTRGGRCWPPRSTRQPVLMPTFFRPITTKIPR